MRSSSRPLRIAASPGLIPAALHLDHDVFFAELAEVDLAHREDVETAVLVELDRAWHEADLPDAGELEPGAGEGRRLRPRAARRRSPATEIVTVSQRLPRTASSECSAGIQVASEL